MLEAAFAILMVWAVIWAVGGVVVGVNYVGNRLYPYSGYLVESRGPWYGFISAWTCKECGTYTKCPRRNAGLLCKNRKCRSPQWASVQYWKAHPEMYAKMFPEPKV